MAVYRCKSCGAALEIKEGQSVVTCDYCDVVQTVPKANDEKKMTLFARANKLRSACEFDKAAGIFESIIAEFPEEAEAYWGLVLCKYGIEYVDDPKTGKKIPTCHRSSYDSVMDDGNFELAMENADEVARRVYLSEAKAFEEIRKGIIKISSTEEPYDIFICYKETDSEGKRTLDSVIAQDLYMRLTDKGYRVFFSRITLKSMLGEQYEPYIFAALNSAKIMLAVGTSYEHFHAVWVKNEWSRFLELMKKDNSKRLFPCYRDIDPYDMPKEFAGLQGQNMAEIGADQDVLMGVEKVLRRSTPAAEIKKTEPKKEEKTSTAPKTNSSEETGAKAKTNEKSEKESLTYFNNDLAKLRENEEKKKEMLKKVGSFNKIVLLITVVLELAVFVGASMELYHLVDINLYDAFTNSYLTDQLLFGAPAFVLVLLPAAVSFLQAGKNNTVSKALTILSRIISFLGMLIFFGVAVLIAGEARMTEEYVWFIWNGVLYLVPFITLFFKKTLR